MPFLKKVRSSWFIVHRNAKTIDHQLSTASFEAKRGFTLIELLIVIAIIGILTAIGTVAYSSAQQRSRDLRRKQDLQAIKTALILYYQDKGRFPGGIAPTCAGNSANGFWSFITTAECDLDATLEPTYTAKVPMDPQINNSSRYYGYTNNMWCGPGTCTLGNKNKVVLWMYLENTKDQDRGSAGLFGYGDLSGREYMLIVSD